MVTPELTVWNWTKDNTPRSITRSFDGKIDCVTQWRYDNGRFVRRIYPKTLVFAAIASVCAIVYSHYESTEQARTDERHCICQRFDAKLKPQNNIIEKLRKESNSTNPDITYIRRKIKKLKVITF